ncbi:hypothetical protein FDQ92_09040 [Desulfoglaeba alkanexedens ALDC]|uniref:Uncharacterized protein n=1 Tax=Desulfoglaeba alkanexedens ALDC TaxID=980445 RepID=A0A4V1ERN8_9BACT|nr:hypothetical protein FDQ92_09040 [Desulfoglaeba alkanexedens ALDC]
MAAREKRSSRRGQWEEMRKGLTGEQSKKGFEEREKLPEKACGKCKHFSENAWASDGRGFCAVLKVGSNLAADPPVCVLEGDAGMMTMFNMDASRCPYYDQLEFIDTDATECADPQFRRAQRQFKS